jgi:hypothetical protein
MPNVNGVSQPLPAGSPNKNGAPAIRKAAAAPMLDSSTAPTARLYQLHCCRHIRNNEHTENAISSDTLLAMLSSRSICDEMTVENASSTQSQLR